MNSFLKIVSLIHAHYLVSKVPAHRPVIVEKRGLELLQVVAETYSDVKTIRFLSQILGNLALDEKSHKAIITKGVATWYRFLLSLNPTLRLYID